MISVTLTRESLELDPLVLVPVPAEGDPHLHLMEEDCTWPQFTMRRTFAPASETVGGEQLLAAVPGLGSIGLGVSAHGDTTLEVETAKAELTAATTQRTFTLTLVVDGVTIGTYNAHPEYPNWGTLDSGDVKAHINKGTVTIPLNPPAGA